MKYRKIWILLVSVKKNYINVSNHKIWNFFFSSNKAIYWCLANKISREREKVNWNFNRFITHVGTVLNKDILSFICFPLHGAAKVYACCVYFYTNFHILLAYLNALRCWYFMDIRSLLWIYLQLSLNFNELIFLFFIFIFCLLL